jgi:hypothetical protein
MCFAVPAPSFAAARAFERIVLTYLESKENPFAFATATTSAALASGMVRMKSDLFGLPDPGGLPSLRDSATGDDVFADDDGRPGLRVVDSVYVFVRTV